MEPIRVQWTVAEDPDHSVVTHRGFAIAFVRSDRGPAAIIQLPDGTFTDIPIGRLSTVGMGDDPVARSGGYRQ